MAKCRVVETSFINNVLVHADDVIEFDGIPGPNLEPLDKDGKKLAEAYDPNGDRQRLHDAALAGVDTSAPV